jgi:hypothetical protein
MSLNALTRELHANERLQLLTHLLALDAAESRYKVCGRFGAERESAWAGPEASERL